MMTCEKERVGRLVCQLSPCGRANPRGIDEDIVALGSLGHAGEDALGLAQASGAGNAEHLHERHDVSGLRNFSSAIISFVKRE